MLFKNDRARNSIKATLGTTGIYMLHNTNIQSFTMNNLPLIIERVAPLWSPPIGDERFKKFSVEYIVRNNIADNDYRFQLVDESGRFLAAAFFMRKGDRNCAEEWFTAASAPFPDNLKKASDMSRTYLTMMDERTFCLMDRTDIKLSLFVSIMPGTGSAILDSLCKQLSNEGWKHLYLWTDCECNWQWYVKHGFALVQKDVYEPFRHNGSAYETFIFKRALQ